MEKKLGIIMLDTKFPRVPGDVGNEASFPFPIVKKVVSGADPQRVVLEGDQSLLKPFTDAAKELEKEGVAAITTSCGFLSMFHRELSASVDIPVFTSALLQVKSLADVLHKGKCVGILTANSNSLGEKHFRGVGIEQVEKVVYGMENTYFHDAIVGNLPDRDESKTEACVVEVALKMLREHPEVGAIVLECTNMPPYARAISSATGLPVFDIITMADCVMQACCGDYRYYKRAL